MIGSPPSLMGGVNEIDASPLPAMAVTAVGGLGTVEGTTLLLGDDGALFPPELVATTEKVYGVPLVRPETTIGEDAPEFVNPPGLLVTVYPVIGVVPV